MQLATISQSDESLQGHDFHLVRIYQMFGQSAADVIISKRPTLTAKNEISLTAGPATYHLGQANDFKWNFLLGRATHLLPFERNNYCMSIFGGKSIDFVFPASGPAPKQNLLV